MLLDHQGFRGFELAIQESLQVSIALGTLLICALPGLVPLQKHEFPAPSIVEPGATVT